jgi:competence protein ComEA
MKTRIKKHLAITKKEWNGLVVLVVLIALVLAAPYVYQLTRKDNTINFKDFDKAVAQLNKAGDKAGYIGDNENPELDKKKSHPFMFSFNPNNLTTSQWEQLGLSAKQAVIIKHYEDKGGRFYSKEDLKKIYSITADDYKRLEPYIKIARHRSIVCCSNNKIQGQTGWLLPKRAVERGLRDRFLNIRRDKKTGNGKSGKDQKDKYK